jgi:hypothetical protein
MMSFRCDDVRRGDVEADDKIIDNERMDLDGTPIFTKRIAHVRAGGRPVYLVGRCARPRMARAPHLAERELLQQLC